MAIMKYRVVDAPKLKRNYAGLRIRTTREMQNGHSIVAAGIFGTITSHSNAGSYITFDKCDCCRVQVKISRVRDGIEFIEKVGGMANE